MSRVTNVKPYTMAVAAIERIAVRRPPHLGHALVDGQDTVAVARHKPLEPGFDRAGLDQIG
jgi:hypothetical protein